MLFGFKGHTVIKVALALCVLLPAGLDLAAQTTQNPPSKPPADVVRVYTELVQTDVMVFDKQGRFVDGLTK